VRRRDFLMGALAIAASRARAVEGYPAVEKGVKLAFPRDFGSHPLFRNEWWYVTGWLRTTAGREFGMQITFFRNRPRIGEENPSRFAPKQLLFAHAALSDPRVGRLLHDQRAARAGFGLAEAAQGATDVRIDDWSLKADGERTFGRIAAREFDFALEFRSTQPILLEGEAGFSRKGPRPQQASFYYSRPHLSVSGTVGVKGERHAAGGDAWLDHEWSSEPLAPEAMGWDWVGLNLSDGGALMAFRMRDRNGGKFWAGGSYRTASGRTRVLAPGEVNFQALKTWRSPRTGTQYPIAMRVGAGDLQFELEPLMDDQELDSRASTGTIYWEGAVRARRNGRVVGLGYLELTGYWKRLEL